MAWRRGEFLRLPHIDKDNGVAGREAALQFDSLDPRRRTHAWPTEQTGQKCYHGKHSETEQAVNAEPTNLPVAADLPA